MTFLSAICGNTINTGFLLRFTMRGLVVITRSYRRSNITEFGNSACQ